MQPFAVIVCSIGFLTGPVLISQAQDKPAAPAEAEAVAAVVDPMELLAGTADTWKMNAAQFNTAFAKSRPDWLDAAKTQARIGHVTDRDSGKEPLIMGGKLPVYETVLNFADDALRRVQVSIYNRGDAGDLSPDNFKLLIEKAKTAISGKAGNAGQDRGKASGAVLTKGWVWKTADTQFLLESSMKRQQGEDRPEFLRLVMVPTSSVPKPVLGANANAGKGMATATLASLKGNVKKVDGGDVYISNVPMVDQGQKGYCVVATAERVMRYYGAEVDQHEMAQMADSSSSGGTNPDKMTEALDRIDSKFKLRLKRILPWTSKGYLDMVKDYNRAARTAKARTLSEEETYNVGMAYDEMDAETLKKVRTSGGAMEKFKKMVRSAIDTGVPLMWSVHLGVFKEGNLPQSGGGHMRLIIGYNDTSNEILFSDSWGPGHELKRMNAEEAWTITSGLYGMEPKAK